MSPSVEMDHPVQSDACLCQVQRYLASVPTLGSQCAVQGELLAIFPCVYVLPSKNLLGQALSLEPLYFHLCVIVLSMVWCVKSWSSIDVFIVIADPFSWPTQPSFVIPFRVAIFGLGTCGQFQQASRKQKPPSGALGKSIFKKIGMLLLLFHPFSFFF